MEDKKEIIWIFGDSAAGKETFIRDVVENNHVPSSLNWDNKDIRYSEASLRYIGQFESDPITEKREGIFNEVKKLIHEVDIVLIKGQIVDLQAGRIKRLRSMLPSCKHKIVYLDVVIEKSFERWKNKSWYTNETIKDAQEAHVEQLALLNQLNDITVQKINYG